MFHPPFGKASIPDAMLDLPDRSIPTSIAILQKRFFDSHDHRFANGHAPLGMTKYKRIAFGTPEGVP